MSRTESLLSSALMRRLEALALSPSSATVSPIKGERQSAKRGYGQDFLDYRDYGPGDDPRYVDWNAAARTNKLFVRVYHEERDIKLVLVIDTSESMNFGLPSRLHFAAQLAAALGFVALCGNDRVTVQPFSVALGPTLPPLRGKSAAPRLFAYLQALTAGGGTSIEASLHRLAVQLSAHSTVIIISDFFDGSWRKGAAALRSRGHNVTALHILLDEELQPELTGDLTLIDSETAAFVNVTVSPGLLSRYTNALQSYRNDCARWCSDHGVQYLLLRNTDDLERLVMTTLRKVKVLR